VAAVFVALFGAALRLWGIGAGAPFRMGVDEPVIVSIALRMIKSGDFHPHFFDYGGLTLYLHSAVAAVTFLAGAMDGRWASLDSIWEGDTIIASRMLSAVLGSLTVVIVFRAGLRWGQSVALIAALAMAVLSPAVREAHFALTDTPLTFFVALTLLLSLRAAETGRLWPIVMAGAAVGLAAAIKYNGVVALVMPTIAVMAFPRGRRMSSLLAAAGGAAVAFLVSAPYTWLDLPAFLDGFASLMQHYNRKRPLADSMLTYVAYLRNWFGWPGVLPAVIGYGALATAVAGWLALLAGPGSRNRRIPAAIVAVFPFVYFWFVSAQGALQYGRYLLPIAPMLCVGLAVGTTAIAAATARLLPRRARVVLPALAALLLAPPTAASIAWNRNNSHTTTMERAAAWIVAHAKPGEGVVVEDSAIHLPPAYSLTRTPRLADRTPAQHQADNISFLLASSAQSDRYYSRDHIDDPRAAAYGALLASTESVAEFKPDAGRPDPTITILRMGRGAAGTP
jgi:4-amino-4-deoxy-L-arabinose transferase-like glycosyltransferase